MKSSFMGAAAFGAKGAARRAAGPGEPLYELGEIADQFGISFGRLKGLMFKFGSFQAWLDQSHSAVKRSKYRLSDAKKVVGSIARACARQKRVNRCPECRTRRATLASMLAHIAKSGHKVCNCGGYHYAHRPMSPFCEKHPMQELHEAVRRGADKAELLDVEIECVLNKPGRAMKGWK